MAKILELYQIMVADLYNQYIGLSGGYGGYEWT